MPPQNSSDNLHHDTQKSAIELKTLKTSNGATKDQKECNDDEPSVEKKLLEMKSEEDDPTAAVVIPPDGGWGWVVMLASFLCNTVVDGVVFSSSSFATEIGKEFNASTGYVSLVNSLLAGFYLMAGPFVSALTNRWGFRPVTIAGSLVAAFAFSISYFANSVEMLFFTYGILGGIGFCLIYIPSVIAIGYYFEKWRALATGIALCGSGVGTFLFTPFSSYLVKTYGWRLGLLIQAMIILSCGVFGSAYRPLEPRKIHKNDVVEEVTEEKKTTNQELLTVSNKPVPDARQAYSMPNSVHNTYTGSAQKIYYPTAAEVFRNSNTNLERRSSTTSQGNSATPSNPPSVKVTELKHSLVVYNQELSVVGENPSEEDPEHQTLLDEKNKPVVVSGRRHTVSVGRLVQNNQADASSPVADTRPMYRDDVFFTGSLTRITQYTSRTSLNYHLSVTRLATKTEIMEEKEAKCKLCPESVVRTLSTMLDVSLFKSPSFLLLSISGFLTMMGFFVPFNFVKSRAVDAGMDENLSLMIVSVIGITNTVARIVCGLLSSFKGISALQLNNVSITLGGITTILSGYIINEYTQFGFAVCFGICIACFSALRSIIAVELLGLEKLSNAFGFLMLFQGLAATIGSPIAGVFYDLTGSYDASFWLAGALITLSAVLCYPLNCVSRIEQKKLNQDKPQNEV